MASPITTAASPETIPNFSPTSPSDIVTRNRTNAIGEAVLGESPETTPPTSSLIERSITSFDGTPLEMLSSKEKTACAFNILRNA